MLGAGALGRPRGMVWGGKREVGSGWGTHVYLWQIHFDIWQNQYNIVKLNKIKLRKKTKTKQTTTTKTKNKKKNICPSNEHSELISFRMDSLDLLAVQGTLKSLLQHHSSKASILWHSASFIVQLSHPYMTTGKTIALSRWTFVGKVMSLLFNMLFRLVITFLARSKCLLIS